MTKTKPFLKWAGNKFRCIDMILTSFPEANRLIEPFAGSAAIFMNADYSSYLLAEENQDLIALFHCLQNEGDVFINYCEKLFSPSNNQDSVYYQLRTKFNQCRNSRKRAALFLYLNRHGYNGLCRYNQQGIYNVPFGRYIKPYFPRAEMQYFHHKSQQAQFVRGDFRQTFAYAKQGDLIYCDPPYSPLAQTSNFSSYTNKKFGEQEQIILAELAMEYAGKGVTVVISNHDTDFTRHQYRYSKIKSFPVKRSISCNAGKRLYVNELLAVFSDTIY